MILLSDYDEKWPLLFQQEKAKLIQIFPQNAIIEHIGSTAIPNLAAKPVIDIMIGVDSLVIINSTCIESLKTLGYCYVPEYEKNVPERRYFRKDNPEGIRTHQIHSVVLDSDWWQKNLLFRDYLRSHPEQAQKYELLKKNLAEQFTDTNLYAKAKTDFIKSIETLAKNTSI